MAFGLVVALLTIVCVSATDYSSSSVSKTYVSKSSVTLSMNLEMSSDDNTLTITLVGPSTVYFSVGFGEKIMKNCYTIVIDGDGNISERKLSKKDEGDELDTTFDIDSNTVDGSLRTIVLTRDYDYDLTSDDYFTFTIDDTSIKTIWAYGKTSYLSDHGETRRGDTTLTMTRVESTSLFSFSNNIFNTNIYELNAVMVGLILGCAVLFVISCLIYSKCRT